MKIVVCYVTVTNGPITPDYVSRFVGSYLACPPEIDHETIIACNGGPLDRETSLLFSPLRCEFLPRANDPAWDVGAFMDVASLTAPDLLLCLGESVYFHRPGWLRRIVEAWQEHGPGMYGLFSSNLLRPHLNTTAFACAPFDLLQYPKPRNQKERYEFEHGIKSFWTYVYSRGRPAMLVTWDGIWTPSQWRKPKNILWRGTQENCLAYCIHTDRWRAANDGTKFRWSKWADTTY